jgi:hypothetical protein
MLQEQQNIAEAVIGAFMGLIIIASGLITVLGKLIISFLSHF